MNIKAMKKPCKIYLFILTGIFLLMFTSVALASNDVEISTADELIGFADKVNSSSTYDEFGRKNVKIMNDIDLSGKEYTPIGNKDNYKYIGTFDGNGYTISNLHIDKPEEIGLGLFGYVGNGVVKNVNLTNIDISGYYDVGGIAGKLLTGAKIDNCDVTGNLSVKWIELGGITGHAQDGTSISNCTTEGNFIDNAGYYYDSTGGDIGGIVGYNRGAITNCKSSANITGRNSIGGIAGRSVVSGRITNCVFTGTLTPDVSTGTYDEDNDYASYPDLDYALPLIYDDIDAYNPFKGKLEAADAVKGFRFTVDSSQTNAYLGVIDNQASVALGLKIYGLDGNLKAIYSDANYTSLRTYKIGDKLPAGDYYAKVFVAAKHQGWATTDFSVIYTDAENLKPFTNGMVSATKLGRYDNNNHENYAETTMPDGNTEHWYEIYINNVSALRNCIMLDATYSRLDYTIRSVENPDEIIYSSHDLPLRTKFIAGNSKLIKTDWNAPSSGSYYIVVKANNGAYNEPYRLTVGNPIIRRDLATFSGPGLRINYANVYYGGYIDVSSSSTMPLTAKAYNISAPFISNSGYPIVDIKKSTEYSWHGASKTPWSYKYGDQWSEGLISANGTWNYRAKITSSSYVPRTIKPYINIRYFYELGD